MVMMSSCGDIVWCWGSVTSLSARQSIGCLMNRAMGVRCVSGMRLRFSMKEALGTARTVVFSARVVWVHFHASCSVTRTVTEKKVTECNRNASRNVPEMPLGILKPLCQRSADTRICTRSPIAHAANVGSRSSVL